MNTYEVEGMLRRLGVTYLCAISRLPGLIGIARWKLRAAVESRSLRKMASGTVYRTDLAEWISRQPAICSRLAEMVRVPEMGNVRQETVQPLTLTPAALDAAITVTVNR